MKLERVTIGAEQRPIPSILLTPANVRGAALVLHGYGGCKEEVLGLAFRVAECGLSTCAIDLCGHGQNAAPMTREIIADVERCLTHLRQWGKVVAIGHSLGGRLALASGADYAIGLSPALPREFTATTRKVVDDLRAHRVRESIRGINYEILGEMPYWQAGTRPSALIFGSRDIPEIVDACRAHASAGVPVTEIPAALHGDTITAEAPLAAVARHLATWF